MDALHGTHVLTGNLLRRNRISLAIWPLVLPVLVLAQHATYPNLFPDEMARTSLATSMQANPASALLLGRPVALDTATGFTCWRTLTLGCALTFAVIAQAIVRHCREEEESGRAEIIASARVGRLAPPAAALVIATVQSFLIGLSAGTALFVASQSMATSAAFGLALTLSGLIGAGTALVTSQLVSSTTSTVSLTMASLMVFFLLRGIGDIGEQTRAFGWCSPLGWTAAISPAESPRWYLVLPTLGLVALSWVLAAYLRNRRDLGMGMWAPRLGPAEARPWLNSPEALTIRIHGRDLIVWLFGVTGGAIILGSVAPSIERLLEGSPEASASLGVQSGRILDMFIQTMIYLVALSASAFAVQTMQRARHEEREGRVEPVLATAVTRPRWFGSNVFLAMIGSSLIHLIGSTVTVLTAAGVSAHSLDISGLLGTSLAIIPSVFFFTGAAAAMVGALPRFLGLAWLLLAHSFLVQVFGTSLNLSEWARSISPFDSGAISLEATAHNVIASARLLGLVLTLILVGMWGIRTRDVART